MLVTWLFERGLLGLCGSYALMEMLLLLLLVMVVVLLILVAVLCMVLLFVLFKLQVRAGQVS